MKASKLPLTWRPEDWPDAFDELYRQGEMLSSGDVFELGAETMLKAVAGAIEQKTGRPLSELLSD